MKKTFKYFLLALLIIPCALVFTACGAKNLSAADVATYSYDAMKSFAETETYEKWNDVKITQKSSRLDVKEVELTYKENAKATDKVTATKEVRTETVSETTFERKGKGKDTVVKLVAKLTTTTTTPSVKVNEETLEVTVEKTVQTATYQFGKVGDDYVLTSVTETKVEKTVDGTAVEDVEGEVEETKTKQTLTAEGEQLDTMIEATVSGLAGVVTAYHTYPVIMVASYRTVGMIDGATSKATKDGKKVSIEFASGEVFQGEALTSESVKLKFNDYKLQNFDFEMATTTYEMDTLLESKTTNNISIKLDWTSNVTMLTDLTDYKEGTVDLKDLDDLLLVDIM